jgi:ABC-type nickel/cobalt efflux system permease component RcnA
LSLRHLGTARTGAYFSLAPFVGAGLSLMLVQDSPPISFWFAALFMAGGVWLHLTERHAHTHRHDEPVHDHKHVHDEHHVHAHAFEWDGREPHSHPHAHVPLVHSHAHYPDIHHRHGHA